MKLAFPVRPGTIVVGLLAVLVVSGCAESLSPPTPTPTPPATPRAAPIALAVRVTFVGPGIGAASPRELVKVSGATACNSWILDSVSYGETDFVSNVLLTTSDVTRVEAELSALRAVRSVTEIAPVELDHAPAPDPGFRVSPEACT
jgi:hypothetical protein